MDCEIEKLRVHISRDPRSRCGAKQVDTGCFLQLLGLGLLFGEPDRRSRCHSRLSIWIRKTRLSVGIWKAIWVRQALRLLVILGRHGISNNTCAGAVVNLAIAVALAAAAAAAGPVLM